MTNHGGAADKGVIFKVDTNGGNLSAIRQFTGAEHDGALPYGGLRLHTDGMLYGMTFQGGNTTSCGSASGCGIVFRIGTNGSGFFVLKEFGGGTEDGKNPWGDVAISESTLYGMTMSGGNNHGVIFRVDTDGSNFGLLHKFSGGAGDGQRPYGTLKVSGSTLYGMTFQGGTPNKVLFTSQI